MIGLKIEWGFNIAHSAKILVIKAELGPRTYVYSKKGESAPAF